MITIGDKINSLLKQLETELPNPAMRLFVLGEILRRTVGAGPVAIVKIEGKLLHEFEKIRTEQAEYDCRVQQILNEVRHA